MEFKDIRAHLSEFKVGIAGAGGLGSNCAVALARSGIGALIICDYDKVEESNLNRQYYFKDQTGMLKVLALKENIARIDPEIEVAIHPVKLTPDNIPVIFKGCDVVVEALDSADMKEMLLFSMQSEMKKIPVITGSGLAGWGENEKIHVRKIDGTLYICGDELTEVASESPAMAPKVGIVANMQANVVIEILMNSTR
ncbi:MAG TPA: sulfur carrier protein ThiS adenylyltransferase ThiF [Bacteroidales bacterium]|nr:sulfur carrier protein ThiS adenylyltransferase ThiF [Bacteroidales bacterium]